MVRQFLTAFLFTFAYAVMRYAGFGHVSLIHVPVYILNKAISMTAAESLFMASLRLGREERDAARFWMNACKQLVFVHVLLSLGILSKGYFASYFNADKMSLTGELVLLMGVSAAYCLWRLQASDIDRLVRRRLSVLMYGLVASHLVVMGLDNWTQVQKWNGGLPPITLLSFLLVVPGMVMFVRTRERSGHAD